MIEEHVLVQEWRPEMLETEQYDLHLATIGYESRSRFVAETIRPTVKQRIAYGFTSNQACAYQQNSEIYKKLGYNVIEGTDLIYKNAIPEIIIALANQRKCPKILIDISSLTRLRVAYVLEALLTAKWNSEVQFDLIYCLAKYTQPSVEDAPILKSSPVTPFFAGWPSDPSMPTTCIIGLGYQPGRAVGAIEYLEPGAVWLFRPIGEDARYIASVDEAKTELLSQVPNSRILDYVVQNPYYTFSCLRSLVAGTLEISRPVCIPFGPKIFAAICMLVAAVFHPRVSVWRISSDVLEKPVDRQASGAVMGIRVTLNQWDAKLGIRESMFT